MSTFVSVGNATQPFSRLITAISDIAITLPQPLIVQYGNTPWNGSAHCTAEQFMEMEKFDRLVTQAELLILHAGAGSVIHAVRAGKVPVVIPRRVEYGEIIDNHQVEFARELARTGKVVLAEEPKDLPAAIAEALKRQRTPRSDSSEAPLVGIIGGLLRQYAGETQ